MQRFFRSAGQDAFPAARHIAVDLLRYQRLAGISFGSRESEYHYVPVIAPFFLAWLRDGKDRLSGFRSQVRTAPDEMPHGIFRFYPRTSGHSPARASLHCEAQPEPSAFQGGMLYRTVPHGAEAGDLIFASGPYPSELSMEQLYS